jgi:hypothetical protein
MVDAFYRAGDRGRVRTFRSNEADAASFFHRSKGYPPLTRRDYDPVPVRVEDSGDAFTPGLILRLLDHVDTVGAKRLDRRAAVLCVGPKLELVPVLRRPGAAGGQARRR